MAEVAQSPVDLEHLDRYTGGNRAVNEEILRLFEESCNDLCDRLEALVAEEGLSAEAKRWRELTHTLKGAARGIGAFALGDAAESAERVGPADPAAALKAVERIKLKSQAVCGFIQAFLRGEP
jgi:HPt (histidine-containing phosphotransfer) domain-containing protein